MTLADKSKLKSNVTVASNIYVRAAATLQTDDDFLKNVYGHKALNILKTRFPKSFTSRLTRAQIEEMKQNVVCRVSKTKEHAFGKAAADGKTVWSCRCENTGCYAYERCMNLPNALRINRDNYVGTDGEISDNAEIFGFDYDKCSFEPPEIPEKPQDKPVPDITELIPDEPAADLTAQKPAQKTEDRIFPYTAENLVLNPSVKTLIICENAQEAGYLSTLLFRNRIKHRSLCYEGFTLNRRIADIFWDFCGDSIEKDAFLDRCSIRLGSDDKEAEDFYRALAEICGDAGTGELKISRLADALGSSPRISEYMLNMTACSVTVTVPGIAEPGAVYGQTLILEGDYSANELLKNLSAFILKKEEEWCFTKSRSGRGVRLDNQFRPVNVELGLNGDVDCRKFLLEETGDVINLQLYIAERVRPGDRVTIGKNTVTGEYTLYHRGVPLGGFPDPVMREIFAIDGFPQGFDSFDDVYIRNIVTCVGDKNDLMIPTRFRESRIWLGLEITGYAKIVNNE